jgi:hypothetical protein
MWVYIRGIRRKGVSTEQVSWQPVSIHKASPDCRYHRNGGFEDPGYGGGLKAQNLLSFQGSWVLLFC